MTKINFLPKLTLLIFFCLLSVYCGTLPNNEWLQRKDESLIFRYKPRDEQLMEQLLPKIINDIDSFQRSLGFYPLIKGEIIIAPDQKYYRSVIAGFSGIIEFSEAVYIPAERRIYIRNPRDLRDFSRLRKIILHEYIHLFLDSIYYNVPLWFHEGMAVFFSGDLSFDRELLYARDHLLGNSLTLDQMKERYPDSRVRWESFYAKSALAVKYLYGNKREEFYDLWEYNEQPEDFRVTFFRAFNMSPRQFSPLFEEHLKRRFRIEILLAFTGIIWGLLPFILLLAWLRKKWHNYRIKKSWDNLTSEEGSICISDSGKENDQSRSCDLTGKESSYRDES